MKMIMCNKCNGSGAITHRTNTGMWTEMCPECHGTGHVERYTTNADLVRKMDDEDLALVLESWFGKGYFEGFDLEIDDVYSAALEWLQQPAEVNNEV